MTIYKMYDGRHIDLSKIVAVGPMVGNQFGVWFQLMDRPIWFAVDDCEFRDEVGTAEWNAEFDAAVQSFTEGHAALMSAWRSCVGEG